MALRVDIGWLVATLLLSARVAGATVLAPVFGPVQVPAIARVALAFALAAMLVAALPIPAVAIQDAPLASSVQLAIAMLSELFIGAGIAFGFLAAYAATQVAGRILDIQMGFSAANVFNPFTQGFSPLLGSLFGMAAIVVFLALDGHHVLVRALAASVQTFPPGTLVHDFDWDAFMRHSGVMFVFGLTLAAPVMFALLLADIAMAVFSRSMPQLNVFVLGFAVKIVLGIIALAASIRLADEALAGLFETTFDFWERTTTTS